MGRDGRWLVKSAATGGQPRDGRRRVLIPAITLGVVTILLTIVAIISSGYDARETPRLNPSVWVTRADGQYARVNTETWELDTVRHVAEPSSVIQAGENGAILSHGNSQAWPVDPAFPHDFNDDDAGAEDAEPDSPPDVEPGESAESVESIRMPEGVREVLAEGIYVLVRAESGRTYLGTLGDTDSPAPLSSEELAEHLTSFTLLDPYAAERAGGEEVDPDDLPTYAADAIALDAEGRVAMYSGTDGQVTRFDAVAGEFVGTPEALPAEAQDLSAAELALIAGKWVLLDPESGEIWQEGGGWAQAPLAGPGLLQSSATSSRDIYIADPAGLWRLSPGEEFERVASAEGEPARPTEIDGAIGAAWLGQQRGTLWTSAGGERTLTYDPSVREGGDLTPVFRSNGDRAVLSDAQTGMLWTLPTGELIPLSQWTMSEPPKEDRGTVVVNEVAEQVPPTAVDDEFGVRAGEPAPLPVLLNDYDPNRRDILTIVAESLSESPLPEDFGTLHLMPDAQSLTVKPHPDASGSASFTYRITDGVATSEPATVTLTVVDEDVNTAPDWCPVDGCQREWTVPAIVPGGTLVYPILEGWVDPEGDAVLLADVEVVRPDDPARAIVTSDGRLALSHTDPEADAGDILLRLTVRDSKGAEQQRDLQVPLRADAAPEFIPTATTIQTGETTTLRPLERIAGGSGSFELLDVSVLSGGGEVSASANSSAGTVAVSATEAGSSVLSLTFRDSVTDTEFTGLTRITAANGGAPLSLPPLRAFVRPLSDSTLEVLDAIPDANARALSVQSAEVIDGDLRADVVDHSRVRVSGNTPDGRPGRIGAADVSVTDGKSQASTRLSVFQVPDTSAGGAIAVADTAVVRAGAVVDIPVLDNDIAPPGERLHLHPEITGTGAEGELAFASGNVLRYLAPEEPGTYRLSYTVYASNDADDADVGTVSVTVLPTGGNADPEPENLTIRVSPGERSEVRVPLSGVDPDGDRVRLVSVGTPEDPQLSVNVTSSGDGIEARALELAEEGLHTVEYKVQDGFGGTGTGTVRIIVAPNADDVRAPIVSTDHVRVVQGASQPAVVRPLDNDLDPADGNLEIVSVKPSLVGGEEHPDYERLAGRLDLDRIDEGVVEVRAGENIGTVSYKYTVESSESRSTAEGMILVHTTERVGAQAPTVRDTVLNVRDRGLLATEGIDVLTNKVRWATGDASELELSLWGDAAGYRVEDGRIYGEYKPEGDRVVFKLSGLDSSGAMTTSYGLLEIPSLDDLRITTKPGSIPLRVDENEAVETRIERILDLSPDDEVELPEQPFPAGRAAASCEGRSGGVLHYDAGAEAPWNDTCLIDVRLKGQSRWTQLPIPITIRPQEPAVELAPLTRTITAGESETINLHDMVRWEGDRDGDLDALEFDVLGERSIFEVDRAGPELTITARADAEPGIQRAMTITARGQGESSAALTLRVGSAPQDNPKGATVSLRCEIGTECSAKVVGVDGEHDPFAGKAGGGLQLESVDGSSCSYGEVSRADHQHISVTWPDDEVSGGTCTIGFTVKDAQDRLGEGKLQLDALGLPLAPAKVTWSDYSADSVSLTVDLGQAQKSYPELTGVEISGPGNASCSPSGATYVCTVTDVPLGSKGEYTAAAVNETGTSSQTDPVTAWAYETPEAPELTITQKETPKNTDPGRGRISISAKSSSDAGQIHVSWGDSGSKTIDSASGTISDFDISAGTHKFTAVAESQFEAPPIKSASPRGNETAKEFTVAGAPSIESVTLHSTGETEGTIEATGVKGNGAEPRVEYGVRHGQEAPDRCEQSGSKFTGLQRNEAYTPKVCVSTKFGRAEKAGEPTRIGKIPALIDQTYEVSTSAHVEGSEAWYRLEDADPLTPTISGKEVWVEYSTGEKIVLDPESTARDQISVRQCKRDWFSTDCSDWAKMAPAAGSPPTTVHLQRDVNACVVPGEAESAAETVTVFGAAEGSQQVGSPDEEGRFTVSWEGPFEDLDPVSFTADVCPEPDPDPGDPEDPDPDDPEDPEQTPDLED